MKLKRVEPDSCNNCRRLGFGKDNHRSFCLKFNYNIGANNITKLICENGYEDSGDRSIE